MRFDSMTLALALLCTVKSAGAQFYVMPARPATCDSSYVGPPDAPPQPPGPP
jgi:hypothetical protein